MRTKLIRDPIAAIPSLELLSAEGGPPERTGLEEFPFSVGRSESCDLQIESDRVSRKHAELLRDGERFRIRDLESTNGTFVNGSQVDESPLDDGDIILIADVELTFLVERQEKPSTVVTQAIDFGSAGGSSGTGTVAIIRQVRRFHEALTHRCISNLFEPIGALESGQILGYEAVDADDRDKSGWTQAEKVLLETECRLTSRIRQLRRMLAAEESLGFPSGTSVFLKIHPSEIGDDWLLESLLDLSKAVGSDQRMVIQIPDSAVSDTTYFGRFHDRLAEAGLRTAYHDFTGGPSHLIRHKTVSPDFVKLAPSLVPSVRGNGQDRRQLQAIVQAAEEIGSQVIATAIDSEEDAGICRDLGCHFGQGNYFGIPQPIADFGVGREQLLVTG